MGDAAHTHGGANAAGGSLAIDDAYALFLSLRHVFPLSASTKPSLADIDRALNHYEKTRRPHTERLLKGVLSNASKRPITTDEVLIERMTNRPSTTWLSEHDVEAAFKDVLHKEESANRRPTVRGESRI